MISPNFGEPYLRRGFLYTVVCMERGLISTQRTHDLQSGRYTLGHLVQVRKRGITPKKAKLKESPISATVYSDTCSH